MEIFSLAEIVPVAMASVALSAGLLIACGKSKERSNKETKPASEMGSTMNDEKPDPKKADAADPNYQTLKICADAGDVFGADKKKGASQPKAPEEHGLARANDPNYQTLKICEGSGEVFEDKKNKKNKKKKK